MDNTFENRLQAIEYELSQIAESEYLEELKKKFNNELDADVVLNIIPSRDISFKTRSLLSAILNRLELSQQDRLDLEKYIVYGGGDNIEYLKQTLAVWVEWKDKILAILEGAPEEFDSLIEIFNYIEQHIQDSNIKLEEINNNILNLNEEVNKKLNIEDSPFEKGLADNSAVLKGGNNQVISEGGVALGKDNIVGLKGWYYKAVQFNNTSKVTFLYLTKIQQIPTIVNSAAEVNQEKDIIVDLNVGDIISVINDNKYDKQYKVSTIEINKYGRIGLKSVDDNNKFPFNEINVDEDLLNGIYDSEDYGFYCVDKPTNGLFDMGQYAAAIGFNNKSTNGKAISVGAENHSYGKFSFTTGRNNQAAYASFAGGRGSKANGEYSCSNGYYTETKNVAEVAFGKYNKSNKSSNESESTRYSVGIGKSDGVNRKNAHEIMQDGKHYIIGIGGYDGTNAVTPNAQGIIAKSVQEVINELVNIINEITTSETN